MFNVEVAFVSNMCESVNGHGGKEALQLGKLNELLALVQTSLSLSLSQSEPMSVSSPVTWACTTKCLVSCTGFFGVSEK